MLYMFRLFDVGCRSNSPFVKASWKSKCSLCQQFCTVTIKSRLMIMKYDTGEKDSCAGSYYSFSHTMKRALYFYISSISSLFLTKKSLECSYLSCFGVSVSVQHSMLWSLLELASIYSFQSLTWGLSMYLVLMEHFHVEFSAEHS